MKFRAVAKNIEAIHIILKSLQACTKMTTNLVFCISPTAVLVIADPSYRSGPLLSRCILLRENIFGEYSFNGVHPDQNLIYFDVRCDSMFNILHSVQSNIKSFKMKLTNGQDNHFVLAITVEVPNLEGSRFITHNVYISLMHRKYWKTFDEIPIEPVQVSCCLLHHLFLCIDFPFFMTDISILAKLSAIVINH